MEATGAHRAERVSERTAELAATRAPADLRAALLAVIEGRAVDAIVQPQALRRKRLLISDMDSTLIAQECIDELAAVTGKKAEVAAITERTMAGELDFAGALTERVALLAGTPERAIAALLADTISENAGASALMARCRAAGVRTVLVSGGFTHFAQPIAERLGMDGAYANRLEVENGTLTGRVIPPILGSDAKRSRLETECAALGIAPDAAIAIGDGANDSAMVAAAGLGIAYRAKPALRALADAVLDHAPLDALADVIGV